MDADEIAALCYKRFQELPRTGKPEPGREWTLLAAVVQVTRSTPNNEVVKEIVSLGTGSKCIGQAAMSPAGDVLNDSHAEVLARRGCIRYLTEELLRSVCGKGSSVLERVPDIQEARFRLRPEVSFVLFTSHTPCGDASIIPMTESQLLPCPAVRGPTKRKASETTENTTTKLPRTDPQPQSTGDTADPHWTEDENLEKDTLNSTGTESEGLLERKSDLQRTETENVQDDASESTRTSSGGASEPNRTDLHTSRTQTLHGDSTEAEAERVGVADVHRTGAKCVPGGPTDPLLPGVGYHSTGLLRVKPGRGDRTLSLSCSDKLARWSVVGFQGALLSHYLQGALYFTAIVVGKCPYSQEAMHRAVVSRCSGVSGLPSGFSVTSPRLLQSSLEFPFSQTQTELCHRAGQGRVSPCGAAISWCKVPEQPHDVTANGYKHGVTKKALGTAKARSVLCKRSLFESFLRLVAATSPSELPQSLRGSELHTYWDYKEASARYQQAWDRLRSQAFPLWPRSERSLLLFSVTAHPSL